MKICQAFREQQVSNVLTFPYVARQRQEGEVLSRLGSAVLIYGSSYQDAVQVLGSGRPCPKQP